MLIEEWNNLEINTQTDSLLQLFIASTAKHLNKMPFGQIHIECGSNVFEISTERCLNILFNEATEKVLKF